MDYKQITEQIFKVKLHAFQLQYLNQREHVFLKKILKEHVNLQQEMDVRK